MNEDDEALRTIAKISVKHTVKGPRCAGDGCKTQLALDLMVRAERIREDT